MSVLIDGRALQDGSAVRGIGTYLRGLFAGFEAIGFSRGLAALVERGAELPPDLARAGVVVHPYHLLPVGRHLRPVLDPLQVGRALHRKVPTLYHAVEYGQPLRPRVPVVVTVHDLVPFVMPREYPWMRRERLLALRQLRHADALIAVSRSTAADVERLAGVDARRITVVAEGVRRHVERTEDELRDLRSRLQLPDRFVLAVGTFDPRKRIDALTEVVRRVRTHVDVALVIAGAQGNFAGRVTTSIRRAGLTHSTRVVGHVSDHDLGGLYQAATCLLFTSAYEGFGLPPLEAMAAGTPVVAFRNSSLPEVIGEAGVLVGDGDVAAMAEAVSSLLADPWRRQRFGELARRRAAQFSWDATARATLAVYQRALGQA